MLDGGSALWLADGPRPELPADIGAVVKTSGSTGAPRHVMLSRDALAAAAQASAQRLGHIDVWHLSLPRRYVAGLMVQVRAHLGGGTVAEVASDLTDLRPGPGSNAISVVPTQLHRGLQHPEVTGALAGMTAILVGGAALSPQLRQRATAAGLPVIETYGMSETCGGVVWDGQPLPGVNIELVADPRAPQGSGRIQLATRTAFAGYLGDEAATAQVLHPGGVLTQDWGRLTGGRLDVGGRLDDVVITGGINVDLAQVRAAVTELDPNAAVIAVPDDEWGQRIVLVSELHELSWWRDRLPLPRPALPRQRVAAKVPYGPNGKPDHRRLLSLVQS
ncbi:MAG: AMP-dependent synthetase [Arachnia propionica]|nr:MAG: AMP-dependent synthetase [Arachnia propionica]